MVETLITNCLKIGWEVSQSLFDGMNSTFNWINEQVNLNKLLKNKKFNFDFYITVSCYSLKSIEDTIVSPLHQIKYELEK